MVLDTPSGVTPIYVPNGTNPNALFAPPPGIEGVPPAPPPSTNRNGTYAGVAEPLDTGGGLCIDNLQVNGFHVRGKSVRFGGYHGTIDAENGVQMVYGTNWIVGQFDGASFRGQLDLYRNFDLVCTYMLTLERVGP